MTCQPEFFEQAKALVERPSGIEFAKFPLKFAIPAYFGAPPEPGRPLTVNNGSASLLRLGGQMIALTCSHVLDGYRQRLAEGKCIFQLGNCALDPFAQLKVEDAKLDYALISVTEEQAKQIVKPDGPFDGTFFNEPAQWPPGEVKVDEFVAFGGFPGKLRQAMSFDELSFGSFSSGAARITSANETYLVCQFEREFWVKHGHEPIPECIGGMSGGPVFALRHGKDVDILTYEFVGHIYEFSEDYELLYIRLAGHCNYESQVRAGGLP